VRLVMNRRIVGIFLILLHPLVLPAKEKKFKEPPVIYSNTKSYSATCDAVWSAAMPLLTEIGLAPQSMDRQGGFASLKWTKGQNVGYGSKSDVKLLTTGYSGFWASYEVFRIETGTLLVTPEGSGCHGQIKMVYAALQKNFLTGYQWYALESNNFLEQSLLNKIGAQIEDKSLQLAQANLTSPAVTQPAAERSTAATSLASVNISSTPSGGDIEIDGKFVGNTPSKFDLAAGKHQIEIKKTGHRDWTRKLDLLPGANIALVADLPPGENENPAVVISAPPAPPQPPVPERPQAAPHAPAAVTARVKTVMLEPVKSAPAAAAVQTAEAAADAKIVCTGRIVEVPFSSSRPDRKTLSCGDAVTIVSQNAQWVRVKTKDGIEGNVLARFVGK